MLCNSPVRRSLSDYAGYNPGSSLAVDSIVDSCGECKECQVAQGGNHPDIHIVNRDSARFSSGKSRSSQLLSLPIDVIREFVIDQAYRSPVRGKSKFFIIDEADTMLWQAQNALLKTLEEPPSNTYLILISSRPQKFLQTIRSRSQMVRFNGLSQDLIKGRLEQEGVSSQESAFWADFCEGRLGQALGLSKMGLYQVKQELFDKMAAIDYGSVVDIAGRIVEIAKEYGKVYVDKNPNHSSSDAVRQGQEFVLQVITQLFRSAMLYGATGDLTCMEQSRPVEELANRFAPERLSEMISQVDTARRHLSANVNPSLTFESLLIDYCV